MSTNPEIIKRRLYDFREVDIQSTSEVAIKIDVSAWNEIGSVLNKNQEITVVQISCEYFNILITICPHGC